MLGFIGTDEQISGDLGNHKYPESYSVVRFCLFVCFSGLGFGIAQALWLRIDFPTWYYQESQGTSQLAHMPNIAEGMMGAIKTTLGKRFSIFHSQRKWSFLIATTQLESSAPASLQALTLCFLVWLRLCCRDSVAAFSSSLVCKEFMAGCGNHGDEGHKFLEVTFAISIVVQCFHDFVHSLLLFDFLREISHSACFQMKLKAIKTWLKVGWFK